MTLTDAQQKAIDKLNKDLVDAQADIKADMGEEYIDVAFSDIVESVLFDTTDAEVRREFCRRHGVYDRQTGIDPMEDF